MECPRNITPTPSTTLTWSIPGFAVLLISSFNLVPRAFQTHKWYLEKFGDEYKKLNRKVIVPFIL